MNIKNSATLLSDAASHWSFPVTGHAILPVAVTHGDKLRASAIYMANRNSLQQDMQAISTGQAMAKHFGTLDSLHGLSKQSQPLGIKPTEPQLTAAIAHYLEADGNRQQSRKRIKVFLRALLQGGCRHTNLLDAIDTLSEAQDIQVASEYRLGNGRTIDLLIRWKMPGGRSYVVAAEAKFGHQVTVAQLPAYRQQVIRIDPMQPEISWYQHLKPH